MNGEMPDRAERLKAEEKFEEALLEYMNIFGNQRVEDGAILVDWVIVTAEHVEDGGEGSITMNGYYVPEHARFYNTLGLLRYAELKIERGVQR